MNISEVQKELEELQKRVAQLNENVEKKQDKGNTKTDTEAKQEQEKQQEISDFIDQKIGTNGMEIEEVKQHFTKLIAELKDNINDVPTMTCLTIFIAGILVGKGIK